MNSKEAFQLVSNKVRNTTRWYEDELILIQQALNKLENLEKENTRLKKIIKLLKDNLQLVLKQDIDPLLNGKVYAVGISKNYKLYSGFEITKEKYELLKEVLVND